MKVTRKLARLILALFVVGGIVILLYSFITPFFPHKVQETDGCNYFRMYVSERIPDGINNLRAFGVSGYLGATITLEFTATDEREVEEELARSNFVATYSNEYIPQRIALEFLSAKKYKKRKTSMADYFS